MDQPEFDRVANDYSRMMDQNLKLLGGDNVYYSDYKVALCESLGLWDAHRKGEILEFGCGIGRNLTSLTTRFRSASLFGYDISAESVELARLSNPGVSFASGAFPHSMYAGKFDLIFIAGVFHHIKPEQRAQVVDDLRSSLKPGGAIIVFEHNPFNPVTRRMVSTCPFDRDAVLLTRAKLRALFKDRGLSLGAARYCMYFPPALRGLSFMERVLQFLPMGGQYFAIFTNGLAVRALAAKDGPDHR